jgi:uncharacterized membrane-anchored protein
MGPEGEGASSHRRAIMFLPPLRACVRKKDHFSRCKEDGGDAMNLRAKIYVENQKKSSREKLDARLALLSERGYEQASLERDPTVRKLKAELRKADFRLASIVAQEKLNQERAQAKMDKLAAEKAAREEKAAKAEVPEKKEKKGKKEKAEKQAKPEGKKGKPGVKKEKKEKEAGGGEGQ